VKILPKHIAGQIGEHEQVKYFCRRSSYEVVHEFALEKVIAGLRCVGGINVSTRDYEFGDFKIVSSPDDALRQFFEDTQMQQLQAYFPDSDIGPNASYYTDEQGRLRMTVYQVLPGKRDGYGLWVPAEELVYCKE